MEYCYPPPNDSTLINKFGVMDLEKQMTLERRAVAANLHDVGHITGRFDAAHIKAVHKHLFDDVYTWAGEFRQEDIWCNGTSFCPHEQIESQLVKVFERTRPDKNVNILTGKPTLINIMTGYFAGVNAVHAFREGNGRTERVLLKQMAANAGYNLFYSRMTSEEWNRASQLTRYGHTDMMKALLDRGLVKVPLTARFTRHVELPDFTEDFGKEDDMEY